jgi:hypothetical protein
MNTQMKQWCAAAAGLIAGLVLIAIVSSALGHAEWFGVAILSCVVMALSCGVGWAMGEAGNDSMRGGFYSAGPIGVTALVVVGFMYPASLTPTMLAENINAGELAGRMEDYEGRKLVVHGVVSCDSDSTGYLEDPEGSVRIVARGAGHEPIALPDTGSQVLAVGVVRDESTGLTLYTGECKVVSNTQSLAEADD